MDTLRAIFPSVDPGLLAEVLAAHDNDVSAAIDSTVAMIASKPDMQGPPALATPPSSSLPAASAALGSPDLGSRRPPRPPPPRAGASAAASAAPPALVSPADMGDVRWFLQREIDGRMELHPVCSHDSHNLEIAFVALSRGEPCPPITVHGGHYDVDVAARKARAVYWPEENIGVHRGLWFEVKKNRSHTSQPCPEELSDTVERVHRRLLLEKAADPLFNAGTYDRPLHIEHVSKKQCVVWYNIDQVFIQSTKDTVAGVFGDSCQIARGYRAARGGMVDPNAELGELHCHCGAVKHLVLVAHGIGQAFEGLFHKSVDKLRDAAHFVAETGQFGPQLRAGSHRVEFLPIQWRSSLVLDEGTISALTLAKLDKVRHGINATVLDVLFFTSPVFCQQIIDSIVKEMNRVYGCFIERNPHFWENGGQISVLGHSLGSVIAFDVLSNQTGQAPEDPEVSRQREIEFLEKKIAELRAGVMSASMLYNMGPSIVYGELNFPVETLFTLGSPLGLFLALRGYKAGTLNSKFSDLKCRLMNIYHTLDPVAYRLEPLLGIPPLDAVTVNAFSGDSVARGAASLRRAIGSDSIFSGLLNSFVESRQARKAAYTPFDAATAAGRVDFALPQEIVLHEYVTAMSAHTSYWSSRDLAALLLHQVYQAPP